MVSNIYYGDCIYFDKRIYLNQHFDYFKCFQNYTQKEWDIFFKKHDEYNLINITNFDEIFYGIEGCNLNVEEINFKQLKNKFKYG
jgi:UDP-N-acetylmuramoylalanine-D-glutamate ligase